MSGSYVLVLIAMLAPPALAQDSSDELLSDKLNARLPAWLRLGGEARTRYEGFSGSGFRPASSDDHLLTRVRFNILVRPYEHLSFFVQAQDARVFGTNQRPVPTSYNDKIDLRIGYIEVGNYEIDPVSMRAGRQELNFGEQRMIGYNSWRNTAQSFDAVRVILRRGDVRLDVFASAAVQIQDRFNRTVPGNNLHGMYGTIERRRARIKLEPYILWRLSPSWRVESGGFGRLSVFYPGVHVFGAAGARFDYDLEIVFEYGHSGLDHVSAWAGHWRAGYRAGLLHWLAEYNFATGDKHPGDQRQGGFTAPYPSNHDRYGLADQVGWKNIHHLRTGVDVKVRPKWEVFINVHNYWLASASDGLFTPSNLQLARVERGARSRRVGWEPDISTQWTPHASVQIGAGYARLIPGAFLREATPGVAYNYSYCFAGYRF